ncbi:MULTISPECIES: SCO family protein [Paraburkholderia]|nr:SCO family protein [Paraburkholderia podalyriae]
MKSCTPFSSSARNGIFVPIGVAHGSVAMPGVSIHRHVQINYCRAQGRHCEGGDMTAWTRRDILRATALAAAAGVAAKVHAQHGNMGPVRPPVRLTDVSVVDQTGTTRTLEALLREGITAVQTIYTGCSSVCPLQGTLFGAVQERMLQARTRYPVRLLSIGIDPFGDVPSALRAWLVRFNAGPRWNAVALAPDDVDRTRTELAGSASLPRNVADHSTQVYCFDHDALLRWRSADLPRVEEVCDVLGVLGV